MMLLSFSVKLSATSQLKFEANSYTPTTHTEDKTTPKFELRTPCSALSLSSESSQGISPIVRTLPRTLRTTYRIVQNSAAIRSIDSTTAAHRYGLYNHKILFYAHPRHYYINGLMRLII
ncbi:MAG: hypothetical protein J6R01_07965 [Alistipes sp.]|nr:hypothetical protein [Alistipes sp.]